MPKRPEQLKRAKDDIPQHMPRESTSARGYGWRWQQARAGYLLHHPLCVVCEADGVVRAATEVDHIKAHKGDQVLMWDSTNWQALCKPHHSAKTVREDGGFGRRVV